MPVHPDHPHVHGPECGHPRIAHGDHEDYLHEGHLHHPKNGRLDEHTLDVSDKNPAACTPGHACDAHDVGHRHGPGCGHETVPHGEHMDFLVQGHLHHPHEGHCDAHGTLTVRGS